MDKAKLDLEKMKAETNEDVQMERIKSENSCLILQKLENHYEVKSHEHSINTWNSPQLLKHINNIND